VWETGVKSENPHRTDRGCDANYQGAFGEELANSEATFVQRIHVLGYVLAIISRNVLDLNPWNRATEEPTLVSWPLGKLSSLKLGDFFDRLDLTFWNACNFNALAN